MPYAAPWLKPTDVLGAIQAGSQAGLALRQASFREAAQQAEEMAQERRAADALRMHYDDLGARVAYQQAERAQAQQNAAEALRQHQQNEQHQQFLEGHQLQQENQAATNADNLLRHQLTLEQAAQEKANSPMPDLVVKDIPGFGTVLYNPKTGGIHSQPKDTEEIAHRKADYNETLRQRREAEKALKEAPALGPDRQNALKTYNDANSAVTNFWNKRASFALTTTNAPTIPPTIPTSVTAPTASASVTLTPAAPSTAGLKPLTRDQAIQFLRQASGDKEKARALARDQGYQL